VFEIQHKFKTKEYVN